MNRFPNHLLQKLNKRNTTNALRYLPENENNIDFYTNDYLGFAQLTTIYNDTHDFLVNYNLKNGATGSRLLSGNHSLYKTTERYIAQFHQSETALLFNSGYDANLGFFSSVPQRNDLVLYDALCHASIRDGIQLGNAKAIKFHHNDLEHLEHIIVKHSTQLTALPAIYVVVEAVYSMDGDTPPLLELCNLCNKYDCYLIVDEAHALGVFGEKGEGLIQSLGLQEHVFARIVTFGKALGCHGAAVLGSSALQNYLINFARSFIYTTALSPHAVATILMAYKHLEKAKNTINQLKANIVFFNQCKQLQGLKPLFVYSKSAIQCALLPGNQYVKEIANKLKEAGVTVKPILSPTVPQGQERLRFCIHSFNSNKQIEEVLQLLNQFIM